MKVIGVVFLMVAAILAQDAEEAQRARQYREECISETGVGLDLVERADKGDFVDDPRLHCFAKCFYQKAGFVDHQGEILVDVIKSRVPQEQDYQEAVRAIDKCKDLKGKDSCETVYLVHKCYFESTSPENPRRS